MVNFHGTSTHTLDEKSRLIVPKRFMDEIPPKDAVFTLTASLDGCLLLMDRGSWLETAKRFSADVLADSATRAVRRIFLGHAETVELDKSNRVLVNESLRAFAGLQANGEAVVAAPGKSNELWNPQQWGGARTEARKLHTSFDPSVSRSAVPSAAA